HTHTHTHTHTNTNTYTQTYTHIQAHTRTYKHTHTDLPSHTRTHTNLNTHACTQIEISACKKHTNTRGVKSETCNHTSNWFNRIFPFLLISKIKLHIEVLISL